jgi:hypothetical protein
VSFQRSRRTAAERRLQTAHTRAEQRNSLPPRRQSPSPARSLRCASTACATERSVASAYAGRARADQAAGSRIAVLWAGWAEAVLRLSLDDPQTADAALAPLAAPFDHVEVPDPARVFEVACRFGDGACGLDIGGSRIVRGRRLRVSRNPWFFRERGVFWVGSRFDGCAGRMSARSGSCRSGLQRAPDGIPPGHRSAGAPLPHDIKGVFVERAPSGFKRG